MYKTYNDFIKNGPDANTLREYYKDHTLKDCAKFFNVSEKIIRKVFVYYNIELRTKSETNCLINKEKRFSKIANYDYIDVNEFVEYYYIETNEQICERFNIKSYDDLLMLVKYWGLRRKTHSDTAKIQANILYETRGVINVGQLPEVIEKIKLKKSLRTPEEKERTKIKTKKTKFVKYGDENYNNSAKAKQTILDNYGSFENYNNVRKEAAIITNNEKYGKDWYMQTDQYKESYRITCNEKYGVDYFCQSEEYIKVGRKKYYYNGLYFDSSLELALYIYAINNNEEIIRSPIRLEYVYNNIKHYYFPDFLYKGVLIEIKGDHLLDDDNNLKDGYNSGIPKGLLEAKQKCIDNNNVVLWRESDIKFALNWCKENNVKLKDYKVGVEIKQDFEIDPNTGELLN